MEYNAAHLRNFCGLYILRIFRDFLVIVRVYTLEIYEHDVMFDCYDFMIHDEASLLYQLIVCDIWHKRHSMFLVVLYVYT